MTGRITRLLAAPNNPGSLSHRARQRRWDRLTAAFPDLPSMRVLDLGGMPPFWLDARDRPAHVTTLNLEPGQSEVPWIRHVVGDACNPSIDDRFDLVVSNSLIEHVGGHMRRQQVADVVHSLADRHWVQTPYRYFPIEPHFLAPGLQFLPARARATAARRWPMGHVHQRDERTSVTAALNIELISITEMRHYFPDSKIWFERFAGMVKSLVAIRGAK